MITPPLPDPARLHPLYGEALTPAEQRVAELVCQGLSNKEIAAVLDRADTTIKNQVSICLRKLGHPTRARLIAARAGE